MPASLLEFVALLKLAFQFFHLVCLTKMLVSFGFQTIILSWFGAFRLWALSRSLPSGALLI
jgi:hypothetical protein